MSWMRPLNWLVVVVLAARTARTSRAWAERQHQARCVDCEILPSQEAVKKMDFFDHIHGESCDMPDCCD